MNQEKETILITGGNGLIAKQLPFILLDQYHVRFLTRTPQLPNEFKWDIETNYIDVEALKGISYIVHLAGNSIANKRWTYKRKREILTSRANTLTLILRGLIENDLSIKALISASAIGYYGNQTTENIYDESSPNGNDFLASVCKEWEETAEMFSKHDVCERSVILRFGVVLSIQGGALTQMIKPIKHNIGAVLGKGKQYIPWIHIEDLCNIIKHSIQNSKISGVFNTVAPEHATNKKMTYLLVDIYKKKICLPNIPSWVLKLVFGKASTLLLEGSRISSEKIIKQGYSFKYPTLKNALTNLCEH